jgi:hypothetical protein
VNEDDYVFVPSLRLSATARCSPLFGSDMIKDDQSELATMADWRSSMRTISARAKSFRTAN